VLLSKILLLYYLYYILIHSINSLFFYHGVVILIVQTYDISICLISLSSLGITLSLKYELLHALLTIHPYKAAINYPSLLQIL